MALVPMPQPVTKKQELPSKKPERSPKDEPEVTRSMMRPVYGKARLGPLPFRAIGIPYAKAPNTPQKSQNGKVQAARKPNSVLGDHSSRRRITAALQQPTRKFQPPGPKPNAPFA